MTKGFMTPHWGGGWAAMTGINAWSAEGYRGFSICILGYGVRFEWFPKEKA